METLSGAGCGSKRLKEILSRCLLCGACGAVCANSVDTAAQVQAARYRGVRQRGGHVPSGWALSDWEPSTAAKIISKGGTLLQALSCKEIPEGSGLHLRFPLGFFTQRKTVPVVSPRSFLAQVPGEVLNAGGRRRVGLFVGCGANYLFPESAWALVRILNHLDVTVVVPTDQGCCGLAAATAGDDERARRLARQTIRAFEGAAVDRILTLCASCGSHLQGLEPLFDAADPWRKQVETLAATHKDAMAFLVEDLGFSLEGLQKRDSQGNEAACRVAYHDPCHLRISQGVTAAPRDLLGSTPGLKLLEAVHTPRCCGHGGGFNLTHLDLSMEILDERMGDFRSIGPDVIATGCTGCLLQIMEGVSRMGAAGEIRVCHPLVLVAQALAEGLS